MDGHAVAHQRSATLAGGCCCAALLHPLCAPHASRRHHRSRRRAAARGGNRHMPSQRTLQNAAGGALRALNAPARALRRAAAPRDQDVTTHRVLLCGRRTADIFLFVER